MSFFSGRANNLTAVTPTAPKVSPSQGLGLGRSHVRPACKVLVDLAYSVTLVGEYHLSYAVLPVGAQLVWDPLPFSPE